MIGVDVVDLTDPLLKRRTERALRLIAHPLDSCPFLTNVQQQYWAYWSAKEAVYKAHRSNAPFVPGDICIVFDSQDKNQLTFTGSWLKEVAGYTRLNEHQVLSLASMKDLFAAETRVFALLTSDHSAELRQLFNAASPSLPLTANPGGLPEIQAADILLPASISHHHRLGAVAWVAESE